MCWWYRRRQCRAVRRADGARGRRQRAAARSRPARAWRGGNSQHTRNLRCMHDAPQDVLTEAYPEEEYWQDLLKVTGGLTDEHLARW
jgi:tricarballylate dehydrogenase